MFSYFLRSYPIHIFRSENAYNHTPNHELDYYYLVVKPEILIQERLVLLTKC